MQKKLLITTLMILFSLILCGSVSAANYNTDTNLTLSHNSSVPGDQINCTAKVTFRNGSTNPPVPAGLEVDFWTRPSGGSWAYLGTRLTNSTGHASIIYNVISSTDREMYAEFDDQYTGGNNYWDSYDSDDLEIHSTATNLTVNTTSTDVGSPVTLRSRLTTGGNGWNGQTIHFFVDGVRIGSSTTATSSGQSGWASFTYTPTTYGIQNIQAFFYGRLYPDGYDWEYYMGSCSSNQTLTVRAADVAVTKTVNNTAPNYLDYVTFTVTVRNNGPNTAINTRVTDLLPAGLNLISATQSIGGYNNVTGLWTVGDLANGASATLTLVAQVLGHNTTINNIANGSSNTFDRNLTNNNASASVTVPPAADIVVTKVVNNTAPNYLDYVTFTVTVRNNGPNTGVNTRVSDVLPAGLWYVSTEEMTMGSYDGIGLWTVGDLANGTSATWRFVAQVLASNTTLTNLANGSSNIYDWNLTNNNGSASVTVTPAADIVVTKDVNNTAPNYRDNVTFTVIVRNNGPDDATGVSLDDLLPAGLSWVSDDSSGTYDHTTGVWTIGSLADGASATLQIVAQVLGHNTIIDNVANASAIEFDPNLANNRANATLNVPAAADIAVTKTVNNATPNYLGNVVFTVTVQNNGPNDANGVKLSDLLPAGLVWVSDNPSQGSYDHVTGIWDIGDLFMEQGNVTLTITAMVNKTGNITNVANASSDLYDWNLTNNAANATVSIPQTSELVLSKTVDKAKVVVGSTVKYTITVVNNGPDAALNTVVTDILPNGMQYLSSIASTGSYDPATGLWTIGTMANGATETLDIFVKVLSIGTYENVATVSSSSSNPGTNSSGVVIDVIRNGTNGSGTVPMQHTGVPIALLAFALVMMVAGIAIPKRK